MGLFSAPHRLARHVTISLPIRWHSERSVLGFVRRSIPRLPGPEGYVQAWRWFVNSWVATSVALLLSILALFGGLLLSSRFGI